MYAAVGSSPRPQRLWGDVHTLLGWCSRASGDGATAPTPTVYTGSFGSGVGDSNSQRMRVNSFGQLTEIS